MVLTISFYEILIGGEQKWRREAACKDMGSELFFPERGGSSKEAKGICAGCPVRKECLEHQLDILSDEGGQWLDFGVWGGTVVRERRALLAEQRKERKRSMIYVSGPMTGLSEFNFPRFNAVCGYLRERGLEVVNPAENGAEPDLSWEEYMRRDLRQLLECDSLLLLEGWMDSRGAKLEYHIAQELKMKTFFIKSFCCIEGCAVSLLNGSFINCTDGHKEV